MNGQQRMDLIKLIWVLTAFFPEFPRKIDESGNISCKLSDVAESLGIENKNAHDALADCHSTLSILKFIRDNFPQVYYSGLINSSKRRDYQFFRKCRTIPGHGRSL